MGSDLQTAWSLWRHTMDETWGDDPLSYVIKVGEEAGEVMGAVLKYTRQAATHPDHDLEHIRQEMGQLLAVLFCVADLFDIDPLEEAQRELTRVRERFHPEV